MFNGLRELDKSWDEAQETGCARYLGHLTGPFAHDGRPLAESAGKIESCRHALITSSWRTSASASC